MGIVASSLWHTIRVVGPECLTLYRHHQEWGVERCRKHIWRVGHDDWARWICEETGFKVSVTGLDRFDHHERFVITPNHASWIDIVVMAYAHPSVFAFVGKKDLVDRRWPIVSQILKYSQVVIDRDNRLQAIDSLSQGVAQHLDTSVVMFPEGTRTLNGALLPFKKGAFHAALQSGMRILPVAIVGSFEALPKGPLWRFNPNVPIEVRYGSPISLDRKSAEQLRDETREAIVSLFYRHL